jgi:hypothetical protein|tara:strand:+ start:254 stop:397 length:144 start_codon:yes stop_codon:yes gene_type:complete
MRQFKPLKKNKPNNKEKAIRKIQRERFVEEDRKPKVKRNGILISNNK